MNTKIKTMAVPNISNLLGKITEKRDNGEIPKTERQHISPIKEEYKDNVENIKQENINTLKRENVNSTKRTNEKLTTLGRPTTKSEKIEYTRIGAVIPKKLRQEVATALIYEQFKTEEGNIIKTLDDIVTHALTQLLKK
jgi:hypothetical protein